MERYEYHLAVFSKLLRGRSTKGPIKPGTESRIVSLSTSFPEHMMRLCDPNIFFANKPGVMEIDGRLLEGGAFLYRPIALRPKGSDHFKNYSVFGRIEARSEDGEGKPGRKFTHCAVLIVQDKWQPELIPWAADLLFAATDADGDVWGDAVYEHKENRRDRALPDLFRDQLGIELREVDGWPLRQLDDRTFDARATCPCELGRSPQVKLACHFAKNLHEWDMSVQGRWLSFAFGVTNSVEAHHPGFFARLDERSSEVKSQPIALNFDDRAPLFAVPDYAAKGLDPRASNLALGINWLRGNLGESHSPKTDLISSKNFWPDQETSGYKSQLFEHLTEERAHDDLLEFRPPSTQLPIHAQEEANITKTAAPSLPRATKNNIIKIAVPDLTAKIDSLRDESNKIRTQIEAEPAVPTLLQDQNAFAPEASFTHEPLLVDEFDFPLLINVDHEWVNDQEILNEVISGMRQLIGHIRLIDPPYFRNFQANDKICDDIAANFASIVAMMAIFSIAKNPTALLPSLEKLFWHEAIPNLGDRPLALGGVISSIVRTTITDEVGAPELAVWIDRQARIERDMNLTNIRSGGIDRMPGESNSRAFRDLLQSLELAEETIDDIDFDDETYDKFIEIVQRISAQAGKKVKAWMRNKVSDDDSTNPN